MFIDILKTNKVYCMTKIEISIIIPAYNVQNYISRTLESIKNQTIDYNLFEIVIINDGSKDYTLSISETFALDNNNMNINIINQTNAGVSVARNNGIANAKGKYIVFLDGDDYVEKEWLASLYNKIENESLDFVYCRKHTVDNYGNILDNENKYKKITGCLTGKQILLLLLRDEIDIHIGNFIFKKDIALSNRIIFKKNIKYGEDLDFEMNLLVKCSKVMYLSEHYMNYVVRKDSAMQTSGTIDYVKNIRVFYDFKKSLEMTNPENLKIAFVIDNYRIPKCIVQILTRWSIMGNDKLFDSLLSRKFTKRFLSKSIKSIAIDYKLVIKCLTLLLSPNQYRKKYNRSNYEHLFK
jgi:glycosyltransferase involved in cell wall biosynthesis